VIAIQTFDVLFTQIALFYGFIIVGYLVTRLSGKGKIANKYLNSILINILVPILIFYSLLASTPTSLVEIPIYLVITLVIHLLGPTLMFLRLRGRDVNNQTKGSLLIGSTFTNALFVPLPLALMFLDPTAVSFVIMFSLTQMILFVTFGSIMGATFGLGVGVRFSLADVRTALNVVAIRQLVIPLLVLPIILFSTLSQVPIQVLILESLMPPAILTVVYASGFDLDVEISSTTVTVGHLLLLPLIPIIAFILG